MASIKVKIDGKVVEVNDTQAVGQNGFLKRTFVVDASGENSKYANYIECTLKKDNCDKADNLRKGDIAHVEGWLEGRRWEGHALLPRDHGHLAHHREWRASEARPRLRLQGVRRGLDQGARQLARREGPGRRGRQGGPPRQVVEVLHARGLGEGPQHHHRRDRARSACGGTRAGAGRVHRRPSLLTLRGLRRSPRHKPNGVET